MKELILTTVLATMTAVSFGQQVELIKDGPSRGASKQDRIRNMEADDSKADVQITVYLAVDITPTNQSDVFEVKVDKGTAKKNPVLDTLSTPYLDKMERGKVEFTTEVDVLNYLGSNGWEVISVVRESESDDAQKHASRVYIRKTIKK